jgi:putative oxidoreductase
LAERNTVKNTVQLVVLRSALSAVFLWAGTSKAPDPSAFALAIERYRLLPWPICAALALYLPWLEILAALGLWRRSTRVGACLILFGLSVLFFGALASAFIRGLDISCGCFGESHETPLAWALARTGLLVLIAFVYLRKEILRSIVGEGKMDECSTSPEASDKL